MNEATDEIATGRSPDAFTSKRLLHVLLISVGVWAVVFSVCLTVGVQGFGPPSSVRLLRVLTASLIGAALAVAGAAFQALLRNPHASPYILGISSGTALGWILVRYLAAAGIAVALFPQQQLLAAVICGLVAMAMVYMLAQRRGRIEPYTLLLTGVIVNSFNGAVILFIQYRLPNGVLADFARWMMGRVSEDVTASELATSAAVIVVAIGWLLMLGKSFNLLAMGDETASSMGVRVATVRVLTFALASVMTAAAVALSGPIGFVGLIVPHICRLVFGPDHRLLMITATFFGAAFLAGADSIARATVLKFGGELPVGVITAFCGGPFFIMLLRSRFRFDH